MIPGPPRFCSAPGMFCCHPPEKHSIPDADSAGQPLQHPTNYRVGLSLPCGQCFVRKVICLLKYRLTLIYKPFSNY